MNDLAIGAIGVNFCNVGSNFWVKRHTHYIPVLSYSQDYLSFVSPPDNCFFFIDRNNLLMLLKRRCLVRASSKVTVANIINESLLSRQIISIIVQNQLYLFKYIPDG